MNSRPIVLVALTAAVTFVMACTRTQPVSSPDSHPSLEVKVAFIEDLSSGDASTLVIPSFQAAKLAFDSVSLVGGKTISVQLVGLDTEGDVVKATDVAREVADDPAFVGAIGAPFLSGPVQAAAGDVLDASGIPTITLSTLGRGLSDRGWTSWRRAVAGVEAVGEALATLVDAQPRKGGGACLLGDGSAGSRALLQAVAASSTTRVVLRAQISSGASGSNGIAAAVSRSRCGPVVWGGSSGAGGLLRRWLADAGIRVTVFAGGDAIKDATYLSVARWAGGGTVAACPCVDLSTSTRLADRRFIQDYQADFGLPPGPYAAEGWDVAWMLLRAIRQGAATRSDVLASMWDVDRFQGLAGTYEFESDGDLAPGTARVQLFRDEWGRWIRLAELVSVVLPR